MQKVVGSMIVLAVCSTFGFLKGNDFKLHVKELEYLRKIFTLVRSELAYTKAPLPEVFRKISMKTNEIYREWLLSLANSLERMEGGTLEEVWKHSVSEFFKESKLSNDELEELYSWGNGLGYLEAIDIYVTQLDFFIENIREEQKSKQQLYQSMGVMCGVFLVIILL